MRDPFQRIVGSLLLALTAFTCGAVGCTAVGQVALADSEEQAAEPAGPIATTEPVTALLTGPQVYKEICVACHSAPGVGGAPPIGDHDAWVARIDQGLETLIDHAINGFSGSTGIMPMKGGRLDLSDEEIIAAVEYMVEQVAQ